MTDDKIIELYFARDEQAIHETSTEYGAYCTAIARGILESKEDAEECTNETWLRAWNTIPPQKPRKLSTYLGRITRNISFDRYRAKKSEKRGKGEMSVILDELDECIPSEFDTHGYFEAEQLNACINSFLSTLSKKDRVIFLARYWFAKPLTQISDEYNLNKNTVKASLFRSRNKLKAYLEKEGITV